MPANVLEIDNLNVFYGQGHILHDISLQISSEEAVFILGLNGMGKTTLLRAIMGISPPRSVGTIHYNGIDGGNKKSNEIASMGLGYVPQGRLLFPSLSVEEISGGAPAPVSAPAAQNRRIRVDNRFCLRALPDFEGKAKYQRNLAERW
jgi:ABC-type branched-subunit amino acid transport system ATPase component